MQISSLNRLEAAYAQQRGMREQSTQVSGDGVQFSSRAAAILARMGDSSSEAPPTYADA